MKLVILASYSSATMSVDSLAVTQLVDATPAQQLMFVLNAVPTSPSTMLQDALPVPSAVVSTAQLPMNAPHVQV